MVSGTRDWVMDIRGSFLDCSALLEASFKPPPAPEVDEEPINPPLTPPTPEPPSAPPTAKRSSMTFMSGAFAAAKAAATKGSSAEKGNSSLSGGQTETARDAVGADGAGSPTGKSMGAVIGGIGGLSIRAFRRSSRTDKGMSADQAPAQPSQQSSMPLSPRAGNDDPGFVAPAVQVRSPGSRAVAGATGGAVEERERSSLFGGSSRSPSTSPRNKNASFARKVFSPSSSPSRQGVPGERAASSALPVVDKTAPLGQVDAANAGEEATGSAIGGSAAVPSSEGGRKGRRAFAGGLWRGGETSNSDGTATAGSGRAQAVAQGDTPVAPPTSSSIEATAGDAGTHKPKPPGGGKRRFAGGGFGSPPPPPPPSSAAVSSNDSRNNSEAGGAGHDARGGRGATGATGGVPASAKSGGSDWDKPKQTNYEVAGPAATPAWAADCSNNSDVPDWGAGASNGTGLAPPSQEEEGREAASKSPFMTKGGDAPPARRPSRQRPGAGGGRSRRAFGGGQSLF